MEKKRFEDLVALMARLRAPGGCPWDREQTPQSLRTYLLEETYEVLDAIERDDPRALKDELGDLLLQVLFHAQMAAEQGRFSIDDVLAELHQKLVRRHPHVFGATKVANAGEVVQNWEALKAAERNAHPEKGRPPGSLLEGVPGTLPAQLEAFQLTRRASQVGFDWERLEDVLAKLNEEVEELRESAAAGEKNRLEDEVGDLLFVAVNVARFLGLDPELALRRTNRKFIERFREIERELAAPGSPPPRRDALGNGRALGAEQAERLVVFTLQDFERARALVAGRVRVTPLLFSDSLSELTGGRVYLKAECFQPTHSFKIRAAYGGLLPRLEEARRRGVVTGSSGNFAQGMAYAARELGVPVTVVMLESSAPYKVEAARKLGAEVVFCPNEFSERAAAVERIHREQGKLIVHSFDDEGTIRGNGTLGFELLEQLPDLEIVLVPTSGGGLLGGVAAVIKQRRPQAAVYGVQPENMPSMKVSLDQGAPTYIQAKPSLADGLIAACPGKLPFSLAQKYVEGVWLVSEEGIAGAVAHLLDQEKLVIEPSGAVGVAALLRHLRGKVSGRNVVVVLTGGNVEPGRLAEIVRQAASFG